jgi:hypothetical protein
MTATVDNRTGRLAALRHMQAWQAGTETHPGEAAEAADRVLADLSAEITRQDRFHPSGFPAHRDGVFLGIQTARYELEREALDAWHAERCKCGTPLCGHSAWAETRAELLQAAAIIARTIRSIDEHQPTSEGDPQ